MDGYNKAAMPRNLICWFNRLEYNWGWTVLGKLPQYQFGRNCLTAQTSYSPYHPPIL